MKILFVCTGNTCRSPMAELYFNFRMQELRRPEHTASSAGLAAFPGGEISPNSALVLAEQGISSDTFRSRALTLYHLEESDLIIGMTRSHCRSIVSAVPGCAEKVHSLLEWDGNGDVADPFGGGKEIYRQTFLQMKTALDHLIGSLP